VEKLEITLLRADVHNDNDEVERRARLARCASFPLPLIVAILISYNRDLEDVGRRSLALSEKGKVARALDKRRDSEEVIKLIEKLRQAILVYQVSIGPGRGRTPLTRRTGVTTTVDIQPGHPTDREFLTSHLRFRG
jgi:hypothetical protein